MPLLPVTLLTSRRAVPRLQRLNKSCVTLSSRGNASDSMRPTSLSKKEVREVRIPVTWGHIAGKWWGDANIQPVVGIHGWQDNANSFDRLAPLLNVPSFLALDMAGHGYSSHYPVGQCYHFIDEIANLRRVVKHYSWDKISIVGHSMGSILGFTYAGFFPEEVDSFVSLDCTRGTICEPDSELANHVEAVVEATLSVEQRLGKSPPNYSYQEVVDLYVAGSRGSLTCQTAGIILDRGLVSIEHDKYYLSRDPRMSMLPLGCFSEEMLLAIATQISCQVLSIQAKDGFAANGFNPTVYKKTVDIMQTSARRSTHHLVDGTHHIHLCHPERVATLINDFLAIGTETVCIY